MGVRTERTERSPASAGNAALGAPEGYDSSMALRVRASCVARSRARSSAPELSPPHAARGRRCRARARSLRMSGDGAAPATAATGGRPATRRGGRRAATPDAAAAPRRWRRRRRRRRGRPSAIRWRTITTRARSCSRSSRSRTSPRTEKKRILPDVFLRNAFGPDGPGRMNQGNKAIARHTDLARSSASRA